MKNRKIFFILVIVTVSMALLSACALSQKTSVSPKGELGETNKVKDNGNKDVNKVAAPKEPTVADECAFCQMVVYGESDEMGAFTAQAINEDGDHLFFDDSGCLPNMERKLKKEFSVTWVRDYTTMEWIEIKDAVVVKGDFQTPMKYGYVFFKDDVEAELFIKNNADKNAVISSWEEVDSEAYRRYLKKMESEKKHEKHNMNGPNDADDSHES